MCVCATTEDHLLKLLSGWMPEEHTLHRRWLVSAASHSGAVSHSGGGWDVLASCCERGLQSGLVGVVSDALGLQSGLVGVVSDELTPP